MALNFSRWYDYDTVRLVGRFETDSDYAELAERASMADLSFADAVQFGMGMAAEYDRRYGDRVEADREEAESE